MPKKLKKDALLAEKTSLEALINRAKVSGDVVGKIQFVHRKEKLDDEIAQLGEHKLEDNNASLAVFFGGQPVFGSKGIATEFAGSALEQLQDIVSKTFVRSELGAIGTRGKVPLKRNSELMVTGLARGSFGFVLDEMSDQTDLQESGLSHVIDIVAKTLRDTGAQDEAKFESLIDTLDGRTLLALKEFFSNLDSNHATVRIVEGEQDFFLDAPAVHRAKIRTEATSIEEDVKTESGVLVGFLPEHKKFELRLVDGSILYGSASKEAVEQFKATNASALGKKCTISVTIKTIQPLNRPPRAVVRLQEFRSFK